MAAFLFPVAQVRAGEAVPVYAQVAYLAQEFQDFDDFEGIDDFDDFGDEIEEIGDPFESFNRKMFSFNRFFENYLIRPLATAYNWLPELLRDMVHNLVVNLGGPATFANDLLQGEGRRAGQTFSRLLVNSTVGIGGLFDVAGLAGMPGHEEDFGQTLAVWGVPTGPYLVIPLFGPSNPRDGISLLADSYMDPFNVWMIETNRTEYGLLRLSVDRTDEYSRLMDDLDGLKETTIDYYAAIRSLQTQKRAVDIRNGRP